MENTEDVFLVTVGMHSDPEEEFVTFCRGSNELGYFLLHYNTDLYYFIKAEAFCPASKMYWNYKDLLNNIEKKG